jgi:hypothetical protein
MAKLVSPSMHNNAPPTTNTTQDKGDQDNKIMEVETKIRLWKMLANALHQVE